MVPSLFPCIEQPIRAIFSSPSHDSFLTVSPEGTTSTAQNRSKADEFLIIPQNEKDGKRTVLLKSVQHDTFLTCNTTDGSIHSTHADSDGVPSSTDAVVSSKTGKQNTKFTLWHLSFHDGGYTTLSTYGATGIAAKHVMTNESENVQDVGNENITSENGKVAPNEGSQKLCLMREEGNSVHCQPIVNGEEHDENAIWKVEFQTGELLFISSATQNKRIRCDLAGALSSSNNWKGWEVWRFAETADRDGSVLISSFCHDKYFLCSDQSGTVFTNKDRTSVRCKWVIEKAPSSLSSSCLDGRPVGVVIKSVLTGRTLTLRGNTLCTVKPVDDDIDLWQLETAHRQAYYMRLASNTEEKGEKMRIGINARAPYTTKFPLKRANEEWKIEIQTDLMAAEPNKSGMIVTLQSEGQKTYLASNSDGTVYPALGPFVDSLWRMDDVSVFGCTLTSLEHGRVLTRTLRTVPVISKDEQGNNLDINNEYAYFQPEPRLPRRLDAPKMSKIALLTTFAVVTTVAVPLAIEGAVAVLGIAEASAAADILAVGMAAGEAIEGVILVGVAASVMMYGTKIGELEGTSGRKNDSSKEDENEQQNLRPLCLWREW